MVIPPQIPSTRDKSTNKITKPKELAGFALPEIIVSMTLFVILVLLVSTIYILAQQSYNKNSDLAELTQNARVALDRLSRELRQSSSIVTSLPPTESDPENPPPAEIFFQDGHNISQITYLNYYLNNNSLMRKHKAYYFESDPSVYVTYNSADGFGSPPLELILEDRIVGEYFNDLIFWGSNNLINISLTLQKNRNTFQAETSVFSRN